MYHHSTGSGITQVQSPNLVWDFERKPLISKYFVVKDSSSIVYDQFREIRDIGIIKISGCLVNTATGNDKSLIMLKLPDNIPIKSSPLSHFDRNTIQSSQYIPFCSGSVHPEETLVVYRYSEGQIPQTFMLQFQDENFNPINVSGYVRLEIHCLGWDKL